MLCVCVGGCVGVWVGGLCVTHRRKTFSDSPQAEREKESNYAFLVSILLRGKKDLLTLNEP